MSSYYYISSSIICVLIRREAQPRGTTIHATIYVSSYYYTCALILLQMCSHTTISVSSYVSSHSALIDAYAKRGLVSEASAVFQAMRARIYICIYEIAYIYTCMCINLYLYMCIFLYVCMYIYICISMYVCVCAVCVCVCVLCVLLHMYEDTYTKQKVFFHRMMYITHTHYYYYYYYYHEYYYISRILIRQQMSISSFHTYSTRYVSSYFHMCVLILIHVSSYSHMCVLILIHMCPHTPICVSSY
jgi:pentatricopeptide repeat protein